MQFELLEQVQCWCRKIADGTVIDFDATPAAHIDVGIAREEMDKLTPWGIIRVLTEIISKEHLRIVYLQEQVKSLAAAIEFLAANHAVPLRSNTKFNVSIAILEDIEPDAVGRDVYRFIVRELVDGYEMHEAFAMSSVLNARFSKAGSDNMFAGPFLTGTASVGEIITHTKQTI